ncbi:MAG: Uma2 family endonuclease [Candidatus Methylumidiphilus sp.]
MSRPALRLPTLYEQLLALPEHITGEIIDGELYTQPRPAPRHCEAGSVLGMHIGPPFRLGKDGSGGWWIVDAPEIHFVRDTVVVVPDLAGWRRERMPALPEDHCFEVAPDWVCEILSASTGKKDRIKKMPLYARQGVAYAWLVDPLARTLEAFKLEQGLWVLIATLADDEPVSVAPFEAITFSLADLWG